MSSLVCFSDCQKDTVLLFLVLPGTEEPPDYFKAGCKHLLGTVAVKLC